jgi:ribonuclease-3
MTENFQFEEIEQTLGYTFSDKQLLFTACVHSSYAEHYNIESNEKMEFFGDAVLEMVVSEKLYLESRRGGKATFGDEEGDKGDKGNSAEGRLTQKRANTVKDAALKKIVEKAGLDKYLLYFGSKENNLGEKAISSLFEALAAAVYLDGGYEQAKAFILRMLEDFSFNGEDYANVNHKGKVKEFLEKQGKPVPEYRLVEKRGKDHYPTFIVEASADGQAAIGKGKSIKAAEQEASKNLLEKLSGQTSL